MCRERFLVSFRSLRFTRSTSDVPRVFLGGEEDYSDSNARIEGACFRLREKIYYAFVFLTFSLVECD